MKPLPTTKVTEEELLETDREVREALVTKPADRQTICQLQEHITAFLASPEQRFQLPHILQTSYHRRLAHRIGDYFGLQHMINEERNTVIYLKWEHTQASDRLSRLIAETQDLADAEARALSALNQDAEAGGSESAPGKSYKLLQRRANNNYGQPSSQDKHQHGAAESQAGHSGSQSHDLAERSASVSSGADMNPPSSSLSANASTTVSHTNKDVMASTEEPPAHGPALSAEVIRADQEGSQSTQSLSGNAGSNNSAPAGTGNADGASTDDTQPR